MLLKVTLTLTERLLILAHQTFMYSYADIRPYQEVVFFMNCRLNVMEFTYVVL